MGEFVDSGRAANRPGLSQALADARRGTYDILLVHSLDRLARSAHDAAHVFSELEQTGVIPHSVIDVVDIANLGGQVLHLVHTAITELRTSQPPATVNAPFLRSWRKR